MSKKLTLFTLIALLVLCCIVATGCTFADTKVNAYAEKFQGNLKAEIKACRDLVSGLENTDFSNRNEGSQIRLTLPIHLGFYNKFLYSYQYPSPNSSPDTLKDAVNNAYNGTSMIVTGITKLDNAIAYDLNDELAPSLRMINDGARLLNDAEEDYESYINYRNTPEKPYLFSGDKVIVSVLAGTFIMWLLRLAVVNRAAWRLGIRAQVFLSMAGIRPLEGTLMVKQMKATNDRAYVVVDFLVGGLAGFLIGFLSGWFLLGITWRVKYLPGLIGFVGYSVLGSFLHGY